MRLQLWDEVLTQPTPTLGVGLLEGYGSYARGMAYAHKGQLEQAKAELASVSRLQKQGTTQRAQMYGEPIPAQMMALAHDTLAATIARAEKRYDQAIVLLRKAADIDDEFGNDPPLLGGGTRLALVGALMQAGRADEASKEINEALRLNGPSAWTHQGLAQLAEMRGAREESQRQAALARAAWSRADRAALPRL